MRKPSPVIAAEMDVEQPREQPSTGGASSSSHETLGRW